MHPCSLLIPFCCATLLSLLPVTVSAAASSTADRRLSVPKSRKKAIRFSPDNSSAATSDSDQDVAPQQAGSPGTASTSPGNPIFIIDDLPKARQHPRNVSGNKSAEQMPSPHPDTTGTEKVEEKRDDAETSSRGDQQQPKTPSEENSVEEGGQRGRKARPMGRRLNKSRSCDPNTRPRSKSRAGQGSEVGHAVRTKPVHIPMTPMAQGVLPKAPQGKNQWDTSGASHADNS